MSVNSSSPSSASIHFSLDFCFKSRMSTFIFTAFTITNILIFLPLFILVLCLGVRRWRKQRSVATAKHADFFTYNMVAIELINIMGCCVYCCGTYINIRSVVTAGIFMHSFTSPGQCVLHILTCVERYLAVVHPITYLGMRQAGGVRIRNISIGCVWLLCFGCLGLTEVLVINYSIITSTCFLVFSLTAVSFCSLSVLYVLIRPRPGDEGGDRERVDQLKQRAFVTIMAILGALVFRFVGVLVCIMIYTLSEQVDKCVVIISSVWFNLPSSLVLPLLFLHRAGKLPGCKHNHLKKSSVK